IMTELFEKRATQEQTGKVTPITILPDETSNSLIITAPRDMQGMVTELVERLDVQSPFAQQIQIIPLRAARAEQLADTLTDLVQQQQQAAGGARVPAGFAITPEPRTNSL